MKMLVKWYQECVNNARKTHARNRDRLISEYKSLLMDIARADFSQLQIDTAVAHGKPDYDDERYMNTAHRVVMEDVKKDIESAALKLEAEFAQWGARRKSRPV